jgi:hypothetical protein
VLAGCDGGAHDLCVRVGRSGDGDRVETVKAERLVKVCRRSRYPKEASPLCSPVSVASDQHAHLEARSPEGPHVREAAEACAYDCDPERLHRRQSFNSTITST